MRYRNKKTYEIVEMAQIVDVSRVLNEDEVFTTTISEFYAMSLSMKDLYDIDVFARAFDDFTPEKKCMKWIIEFASKFNCGIEMELFNCLVYSNTTKERSITSMTEESFNELYDISKRWSHINLATLEIHKMASC